MQGKSVDLGGRVIIKKKKGNEGLVQKDVRNVAASHSVLGPGRGILHALNPSHPCPHGKSDHCGRGRNRASGG